MYVLTKEKARVDEKIRLVLHMNRANC